ncbi:MAG: ROK family protein, partial [Moorella sp. (in: Bacteria)]|nr:ROK family protein [Moorella sp. (in: firmicutes)]
MAESLVVGVDLGGTKIYTALARETGELLAEVKIPTEAAGGVEHVLRRIVRSVREVEKQSGSCGKIVGLAVGVPGTLHPFQGIVYQAPNLGWLDVPLKGLLEEALQMPVAVDNDANLAALGEYVFGAGQRVNDLVYVTVSTGIGSGLILGGKLYTGASFGAG